MGYHWAGASGYREITFSVRPEPLEMIGDLKANTQNVIYSDMWSIKKKKHLNKWIQPCKKSFKWIVCHTHIPNSWNNCAHLEILKKQIIVIAVHTLQFRKDSFHFSVDDHILLLS